MPPPGTNPVIPVQDTAPAVAVAPIDVYKLPYAHKDESGNVVGAAAQRPETLPGTPEYEVTKTGDLRRDYGWIFDRVTKISSTVGNSDAQSVLFPQGRTKTEGTAAAIGEGNARDVEDAAWRIIKYDAPASVHNAQIITSALVPISKTFYDEEVANGNRQAVPFGSKNDDLLAFIQEPNNGIPPDVAFELTKEIMSPSYYDTKKEFGTDLLGKVKRGLLSADGSYEAGRLALSQGDKAFDGLSPSERKRVWLDIVHYKKLEGENIGMGETVANALVGGADYVANFINGTVGMVDALNPQTAPEEYLAPSWRADPDRSMKADSTIKAALPIIQQKVDELIDYQRTGDIAGYTVALKRYTDPSDPSNTEFLTAMSNIVALRDAGAFKPGSHGEKLASGGEGILMSLKDFKNWAVDSVDPNSMGFIAQHELGSDNQVLSPLTTPLMVKFFGDAEKYWDAKTPIEIDNAIKQLTSSQKNISSNSDSIIYSGQNLAYNIMTGDNVPLTEANQKIMSAYGDKRLLNEMRASGDPITLAMGAAKLLTFSKALKAVEFAEISKRGQTIMTKAEELGARIKLTEQLATAEAKPLIDEVKAAFEKETGRKLTDPEALALVISDQVGGIKGVNQATTANLKRLVTEHVGTFGEDVAKQIADIAAEAQAHLDDVNKIAVEKGQISGRFIQMGGAGVAGTGKGIAGIGNYLEGGAAQKWTTKWAVRQVLNNQNPVVNWSIRSAAIGVPVAYSGWGNNDWSNAAYSALAPAGAVLAHMVIKPSMLIGAGKYLQETGAVIKRAGIVVQEGKMIAGSYSQAIENGIRLELAAINASTTRDAAAVANNNARRLSLNNQLGLVKKLRENGWDSAISAGYHVISKDFVQGGTTGAIFASWNDSNAAGQGFGVGAASSLLMRGLNRVSTGTSPETSAQLREQGIIAEVLAQDMHNTPEQSTRLREWLNGAKDNAEFTARADSYRKAWNASGGRLILGNSTEMASLTITSHLDPAQVQSIKERANAEHPGDPTAAAIKAENLMAEMTMSTQNKINLDAINSNISNNQSRIDASQSREGKLTSDIATEEANLQKGGKTTSSKLERLKNDLNNEKMAQEVLFHEKMQLAAQHTEAFRKVENPLVFRNGETRTTVDGGEARQVADGLFVLDGPSGRSIYINSENASRMTFSHETFEALLSDDAVAPIAKELTQTIWGGEGNGQRISDDARTAFFNSYMASLTPDRAKAYKAAMDLGLKHYKETGSTIGLNRFTHEALAWWMATIDMYGRPVGYGGANVSPKTIGTTGTGFTDIIRRNVLGERRFLDIFNSDQTMAQLNALFDPEVGYVPKRFAGNIVSNLQEAGMKFIKKSDGTAEGFFVNNRGEIVRDPVMSKLYESVLRMTGGKGSPRLNDLTARLSPEMKAEVFKVSGMSWLLGADGLPLPGLDPNVPIVKPGTGAAGGTGTGTPGGAAPTVTLVDVVTNNSRGIIEALQSVPEGQRGIRWSVDNTAKGSKTILWGKPTNAEIAAVQGLQDIPETIKNNMVQILTALQSTGDKPIFTGRYVNVFSRNKSTRTEGRSYVGPEFQFVSDRTFVPIGIETTTRYYNADGKVLSAAQFADLQSKRPAEAAAYTPKDGVNIKVFDIDAFNQNKTIARSEGLRIYDKDGNPTGYVKDIKGRDITAQVFNEIFRDDAELGSLANTWFQHYNEGGPIDPTRVETPGGAITEPSAKLLGNGDEVLGERRLTALRAMYGLTVRKGRVVVNPTNFTNQITRGLQFPIMNIDPSGLAAIQDTGGRSLITQEGVTRGSFNMAPASWNKVDAANITKLYGADFAKEYGVKVWSHPNLENTTITELTQPGKTKTYEIKVGGFDVKTSATTYEAAVIDANQQVKVHREELRTRQLADEIFRDEAKRREKIPGTLEYQQKQIELQRTEREKAVLAEVAKEQATYNAQIQELNRKQAKIEAQMERDAEAQRKKYSEDVAKAEAQNKQAVIELENERKRITEQLRQDIEQRSKLRETEDAAAIETALNSDTERLDIAGQVNQALTVDPSGLPVAILNSPLTVTRVIGGKPQVLPKPKLYQQGGPAVNSANGNIAAARMLGSQATAEAVPTVNRFYNNSVQQTIALNKAIGNVWKTELGNQLVAKYEGVDPQGKKIYRYRIYGAGNVELYNTLDVNAAIKSLRINEYRLRNPEAKISPEEKQAEKVQGELMRMSSGDSFITNQYIKSIDYYRDKEAEKKYPVSDFDKYNQ